MVKIFSKLHFNSTSERCNKLICKEKNELRSVFDLGYPQQLMILDFLKREKLKFHVISSDNFLKNPKKGLKEWCDSLNIDFQSDMLSWEKGPHKNDGIWGIHWYDNINNSKNLFTLKKSL